MRNRLAVALLFVFSTASAENVTVQMLKRTSAPQSKDGFEYVPRQVGPINPEALDRFYAQTGIDAHIAGFDTVEKNTLFLRLRKVSKERVHELYPKIPSEKIARAKEILGSLK